MRRRLAAVLAATALFSMVGVDMAQAQSCRDWPYVNKAWFKANC